MMPMSSAHIAAGITAGFTPHVGGCWKILDLRVRDESRLLTKHFEGSPDRKRQERKTTHPHCITTRVKKYTLCAS
jgi:hypothetical protein